MKWIIDRFEGDFAVVECDGSCFDLPKYALPKDADEGDVVEVIINKNETEKVKNDAEKLLKSLFDN